MNIKQVFENSKHDVSMDKLHPRFLASILKKKMCGLYMDVYSKCLSDAAIMEIIIYGLALIWTGENCESTMWSEHTGYDPMHARYFFPNSTANIRQYNSFIGNCPSDPKTTFCYCSSSVNSEVALQPQTGGTESGTVGALVVCCYDHCW